MLPRVRVDTGLESDSARILCNSLPTRTASRHRCETRVITFNLHLSFIHQYCKDRACVGLGNEPSTPKRLSLSGCPPSHCVLSIVCLLIGACDVHLSTTSGLVVSLPFSNIVNINQPTLLLPSPPLFPLNYPPSSSNHNPKTKQTTQDHHRPTPQMRTASIPVKSTSCIASLTPHRTKDLVGPGVAGWEGTVFIGQFCLS